MTKGEAIEAMGTVPVRIEKSAHKIPFMSRLQPKSAHPLKKTRGQSPIVNSDKATNKEM